LAFFETVYQKYNGLAMRPFLKVEENKRNLLCQTNSQETQKEKKYLVLSKIKTKYTYAIFTYINA